MRQILRAAILTVSLSVGSIAGPASAAVLDFEALERINDTLNDVGTSYAEDGFRFTQGPAESFAFAVFGTDDPRYTGSTALFNNTDDGVTILRAISGSAFAIRSIDLAELLIPVPADVAFVGALAGGGTVSQTFTLDGLVGVETFVFSSGFTNLVSLSWGQALPFHQFDNLDVSEVRAVVPAPAAGFLMLTAVGVLTGARKRRAARVTR